MKFGRAIRSLPRDRIRLVLVAILAVALALRLWGLAFGLPHRYHIDEPYGVIGTFKIATGDFAPRYPVNSPNLWEFILLAEYGAFFVVSKLRDLSLTVGSFAASYRTDPTAFYLLARGTSALLGSATVAVVYLLARDIYQRRRAGLLAALFLAVCFLHGRDSHYGVADALVVFLTTLGVYLWARHAERGDWRKLALGSLLVGVAVGLKVRPIGLIFGVLAAVAFQSGSLGTLAGWRAFLKQATVSATALVAGYLVGFPGLFISVDLFKWHLSQAFAQTGGGFEGWLLDPLPAWRFFLRALEWSFGLPLLVLALGGVGLVLVRRRRGQLTVLAAALGFYLSISIPTTYFARYSLPLLPLVAVLAGGGALAALDLVRKRWGARAYAIGIVLILGGAAIPAVRLARHDYLLTQQDTRTIAVAWIEAHIPAGTKLAVDWPVHGPPLSVPGDPEPATSKVYDVSYLGGKGLSDHTLGWYREQGFDYLITSSFIYRIHLLDKEHDSARSAFYDSLARELVLVAEIRPTQGEGEPPFVFDEILGPVISLWERDRPGPTIQVYRVK